MDEAGVLLGWAPLPAAARGDASLRATAPCLVTIDQSGKAAVVSYHWTELNVQKRVDIPNGVEVVAGQVIELALPDGVVFLLPSDAGPLPAVTVRTPVALSIQTGVLGAVGNR